MPLDSRIILSGVVPQIKSASEARFEQAKLADEQAQATLRQADAAKALRGTPQNDDAALMQDVLHETGGDWTQIPTALLKRGRTKEALDFVKAADEHLAAQQKLKAPLATTPKTEAEMAFDAANASSPTATQSSAALSLLKGDKNRTAEQDDSDYRALVAKETLGQPLTIQEKAAKLAYEKQKTLVTDTGAAAATDRQTRTIAQQIAQQQRSQGFTEAEAGRKELTDKVEKPYQDALAQAQLLRDVVASAKQGNKLSAAMQPLITTLATVRAEGLNRINTVELGVPSDAGSAWDRIVGWAGKATEGQPVPANIQKDMETFAGLLEKTAYSKYQTGHKAVVSRYSLKDEAPLPAPSSSTVTSTTPARIYYNSKGEPIAR